MSTPTTAPVPSTAAADLLYNAERLDEAVNGAALSYTDRFGLSRMTLAGAMARISAVNTRGAWASTTAYAARDVVSNSGTWYIALDAHTSGATFAGDLAAHWRVFQGVTSNGTETLTNKSFSGAVSFFTGGNRIGITSDGAALASPTGLVHIKNTNDVTVALRVESTWEGSTASPYTNNDNSLWETFNKVASNSTNYSWSISAPNAYNNIPVGVTDGGERVGVYGWAPTVHVAGSFVHAGTLASQVGVKGRAGFQGTGTPSTAVVTTAIGVKGEIIGEASGTTITTAYAGAFTSTDAVSTITNNTAVYASATNGVTNYSFYGDHGKLYNYDQAIFGTSLTAGQSGAAVVVRGRNGVEFGNPDPTGYGCNIGATEPTGRPFLVFCAEAEGTSDTFRTRGKKGVVVFSDLAGALIFARLPTASATGQTPVTAATITDAGRLKLEETIQLKARTPASATATGVAGEFAWDANYIYVCTATNTWKRVAISTW
jgi:hypothetical protein